MTFLPVREILDANYSAQQGTEGTPYR